MDINLTPGLDKYVAQKLATGAYEDANEVINEALRLLKHRDLIRE
jgi:putative addiction module CopG family antidote